MKEVNKPCRLYQQLLRMYGKQNWWPARTKFEVVIGAILTQQTSWRNVESAIRNLQRKRLMTVNRLADAPIRTLQTCTYATGFYRQKAQRIRNIAHHLLETTDGNISLLFRKPLEETRAELLSLNGIGKETADSILLYAGNQLILPVDAYTLRVMARVEGRKCSYDSVQSYLERELPRELEVYKEFHALVVEHCKKTCLNVKPDCTSCRVDPCMYRADHCLASDQGTV